MIGWDEIQEGGLPEGAIVQSWQGLDGARNAARQGHDAIASPTSHTYLDYALDKIDLEQAYRFDPIPHDLEPQFHERILGGECNMWTERAPQSIVDSRIYPRMVAIAERLWSGTDTDFEDFRCRLQTHYARLSERGIRYGEES